MLRLDGLSNSLMSFVVKYANEKSFFVFATNFEHMEAKRKFVVCEPLLLLNHAVVVHSLKS